MRARVIGLGQAAAGDDGVGAAVVAELGRRELPAGTELCRLSDPSALVAWLETDGLVILVDAVLEAPAGRVLELTPDDLAACAPGRVSSHGIGVSQAIELAGVLHDVAGSPTIRIVAVTIDRPTHYRHGLSAEVAAAVPVAVERVRVLLESEHA